MRKPYIAGNWKLNLDRRSARELAAAIRDHLGARDDVDVGIFPPFVYLDEVVRAVSGSPVLVGGQNCCDEEKGAFTGEISAGMLADVGAQVALIGHSERRHVYGESDELVNRKVHAALARGLDVVLCVGETLEQREAGETEATNARQLTAGIAGIASADLRRLTIAYEPVWAIGTGLTATPEQAGAVHAYIRGVFAGLTADTHADRIRILYGGSVKPDNVRELMAVPDIDGALVGGASLNVESFLSIVDFGKLTR
jgi:triosephosphate isomerase